MRLNDPDRPLIGHRPAYPHWRPLAAIPTLDIVPTELGFEVEVMLVVASNAARWFNRSVSELEFKMLCSQWLEDPEGAMLQWFGYTPPKRVETKRGFFKRPEVNIMEIDI